MYSANSYLKIIIFLWKLNVIDTFTAAKFIYNGIAQYGSVVMCKVVAGNLTTLRSTIAEPVLGFHVGYRFIKAGTTLAERQTRIATLACFLSMTTTSLLTGDANTNAAAGAVVAAKISEMRTILNITGGYQRPLLLKLRNWELLQNCRTIVINVNPMSASISEVHPYRSAFTAKSNTIIQNVFQEHSARRYGYSLSQKVKPIFPISSSLILKTSLIGVIGWSVVVVGVGIGLGYLSLGLIQDARKKHNEVIVQSNEKIIDVVAIEID